MNEIVGLPAGDPRNGSAIAGRWSFGYDMPDELGGGFVSGELLLRSDGVLLRRTGETGPERAVAILKSRGYDLSKHDPVPIEKSTYGPVLGSPSAGQPL